MSMFGLSGKHQRTILRYSHLLAGMLNVFFIYTPLGDVWAFKLLVQIILVPVIVITGVWMWQQARVRKLLAKAKGSQRMEEQEVRNSSEPVKKEKESVPREIAVASKFAKYTLFTELPTLGRVKLKALTAAHLQRLYAQKAEQGLSPRTVEYIHTTASKALGKAEEWNLVRKNVARYARPLAYCEEGSHKEHRVLTVPQTKALFAAARDYGDRFEALYILALTTGLRRGELLGLKWSDADLERATLSVNRSMDTMYGRAVEKAPKRNSSRRTVALMPEAVAALRVHRKRQAEERLAAGSTWTERDLIFPTRVGTPMSGTNLLRRSLRPLLSKAGLPPVTFHELRHTFATFHLASGERPKVIQEILGHSSIKPTMDTYSHVIPGMQEDAARRLSGLLFGPVPVVSPSNGEDGGADDGEKKEEFSHLQED